MRFLPVVFLLTTACSCAANLPPVLVFPEEMVPMPNTAGKTACGRNGEPFVLLNPRLANTEAEIYVLEHEYEHARWLRGDCFRRMNRYATDSVYRFKAEVTAHCASVRLAVKNKAGEVAWRFITNAHVAIQEGFGKQFTCQTGGGNETENPGQRTPIPLPRSLP